VTRKDLDFGGDPDHVTLELCVWLHPPWQRFALYQCSCFCLFLRDGRRTGGFRGENLHKNRFMNRQNILRNHYRAIDASRETLMLSLVSAEGHSFGVIIANSCKLLKFEVQ